MSAPVGGQTQNVEDTVEEAPAAPIPRSLMDYNISIPARDRCSNYLSLGKHTHTQCVFHIIRLRLIIFHTPKFFNGDFHFNFFL